MRMVLRLCRGGTVSWHHSGEHCEGRGAWQQLARLQQPVCPLLLSPTLGGGMGAPWAGDDNLDLLQQDLLL